MKIINFDFVDTISMVIGLTVEIKFQWVDPNIDFEDAKNDEISEFRIIPDNEKEKIWQPFYHTVYDNAVIGETIKEEFYTLGVIIESNPKERVASAPKESLIYPGAHNPLVATQKMKMKYRCDFFVRNYPFDSQTCDFFISIVTNGNNTIHLTNDEYSVTYDGPLILNEFEIKGIDSSTKHSKEKTSFIYSVQFQRLYGQHFLSTFLHSFLLWLLAYMTLFIDIEDFPTRFMGSVTSLLVLSALLGSMQQSLPKTAYFKVIDLWFNWFVSNIFIIILIHVIVDYLCKNRKSVAPGPISFPKGKLFVKSSFLNQTSKIALFGLTGSFMILYFSFGLY